VACKHLSQPKTPPSHGPQQPGPAAAARRPRPPEGVVLRPAGPEAEGARVLVAIEQAHVLHGARGRLVALLVEAGQHGEVALGDAGAGGGLGRIVAAAVFCALVVWWRRHGHRGGAVRACCSVGGVVRRQGVCCTGTWSHWAL